MMCAVADTNTSERPQRGATGRRAGEPAAHATAALERSPHGGARRRELRAAPANRARPASARRPNGDGRAAHAPAAKASPRARRRRRTHRRDREPPSHAGDCRETPSAHRAAPSAQRRAPAGAPTDAAPRQGFECDGETSGGSVQPPGGAELVATAAEIVGELAKAGLSTGERLFKDVLSRLPLS